MNRLAPRGLKYVMHGLGLAVFGVAVFAISLELLWWFPYWATFYFSAFLVYSCNYLVYARRVFRVKLSLAGYGSYLFGSSANIVVTSGLLILFVDFADLEPLPARLLIAVLLIPLAYLFHTRYTFLAPAALSGAPSKMFEPAMTKRGGRQKK